jgi:ribosome biogenesis SPOUT family RNA methylase Rps3
MKHTCIIEHLDGKIGRWSFIEYKGISKIVGKKNLWFTNIKRKNKKLRLLGKNFKERVFELGLNLGAVCVLDPGAKKTLTTKDSSRFRYFVFGGILGDYPPKKRTKKELTNFFGGVETRNIGKRQFSTDNAVFVVNEILKGKKLSNLEFQDKLEIKTGKFLSVELPYYYPIVKGKPRISEELVSYLKKKKGF